MALAGTNDVYMVRFTLAGPGPPSRQQAELIKDVLWAHASARSGVEHITAIAAAEGVELVIFLRSGVPDRRALVLLECARKKSPALWQWHAITRWPFPSDRIIPI